MSVGPPPEDEPDWFSASPPILAPPAKSVAQAKAPAQAGSGKPPSTASAAVPRPDVSRSRLRIPSWLPRPTLPVWCITLAALVETAILSSIQIENYLGFHTRQGDLGNYNQAFWTTVHGQGFFAYTTNIPGGSDGTLWSVHFSPTFLFLVPLYGLFASPVTLLILKQAALALGAVPVYAIAKVYFRGNRIPILFAALYLLSPLTISADWNNFDPESFIPLAVLVALYFFTVGRFWPFLIAWLIALGTIESAPPILILFAVGGLLGTLVTPSLSLSPYWTAAQQRRPLFIAAVAAAAWLGAAYLVLSRLGRGGAFSSSYGTRYTVLGATSFPDAIVRAVTHPAAAGAALQFDGQEKILFVAFIILASGVIWVFGGLRYILPLLGYLALSLLSNSPPLFVFGSQYSSMFMAFLFVGAIEGTALIIDYLNGRKSGWRHRELALRLAAETRALLLGLRTADPGRRTVPGAVARVQRVIALLAADKLGLAERELKILRRQLGMRAPNIVEIPMAAPSGTTASATASGPTVLRRSRYRPTPIEGLKAVPFVLLVLTILVASAYGNPLISSPTAGGPQISFGYQGPNVQDEQLHSVLGLIPPDASVLTTSHIFPEVSSRPNAYVVNNATQLRGNVTIADDINNLLNQSRFLALDYWVDPANAVIFQNDSNLSDFGLYASVDGANLYERGWVGVPSIWAPWSMSWAGGELSTRNGNASNQFASSLGPTYFHAAGGTANASLWGGPRLLYLPPGTYAVTFDLELLAPQNGSQLRLQVLYTPAQLNDTVVFSHGGYSFRQILIHAEGSPKTINQTRVVTPANTAYAPVSVTMSFQWDTAGYVSFPGLELSTAMSVYLVSVAVLQTSPLP
jgi:uncharacterized membrane protein